MRFELTPDQRALRDELRAYFQDLMTPELTEEVTGSEGGGPLFREAMKRMGRDGWLGVGWPKKYGGRDLSPLEQFLFADEAQYAFFPFPFLTINTVGPTLAQFGTEEQRSEFLPRILAGELFFSIGYSESEAGTDLASLKTTAVRDGDEWVIKGQKLWTSLADYADYVWLAARTDTEAEKHAGISMFIVDTKSPGFSHSPIKTIGSIDTTATYYDDVRVPHSRLVGGEGGGWNLIVNQLNHERVSLVAPGIPAHLHQLTVAWARERRLGDGRLVIDIPWVRANLARAEAKLEVLRLLNWRQAWNMANGTFNYAEASTAKVYGSELNIEVYGLLMEVLGVAGTIRRGSPEALLGGRIERMYRSMLILTFGGGTNEVQRDIISIAGLGMPRPLR